MALHVSTMRSRSLFSAARCQLPLKPKLATRSLQAPRRSSRIAAERTTGLQPVVADSQQATGSLTSTLESSLDEATQNSLKDALSNLGIAPIAPEELFDKTHVDQWDPLLLAYLPVGCVLAVIRMAAWIGGIALDASWFRNKAVIDAYMALLGVSVVWQDEHNIPAERHVLVSNHVTTGDLLMLFQRPQRYVHLITSALPTKVYACQHLPALLQPANKATYLALAETHNGQQQQQHGVSWQDQQGQLSQHVTQQEQQQHTSGSSAAAAMLAMHSSHLELQASPLQQQQQHTGIQEPSALSSNGDSSSSSSSSSMPGPAGGVLSAPQQHSSNHHLLQPLQHLQEHAQRQQHQQPQAQLPSQQQQQQQQPSVHLFPEGGMTNGKGMMRFSRGFMLFADKLPVVPVALRVRVAFPQLRTHTLDSSFLANLFWCCFQPWTVIKARALPATWLGPGDSKASFVQRVQVAIAEELRVGVADISIQQKRQLAGRAQQKQQQQRLGKQRKR